MNLQKQFIFSFLLVGIFAANSRAQETDAFVRSSLSQTETDRIVKAFTAKEREFRNALTYYVFNRSATIQTVGMGGQITGTFRRDSFMNLTSEGQRFEKILFAPISTLTEIQMTPEDLDDLGGINPFALEPANISQYNFSFVGKEKIDELDLYVFDVRPKVIPDYKKTKMRLFIGRIWVDDRDLQIVKSRGKAVPEWKNNKFPVVETWRENVDGKYWFPVYISSDDSLVFESGEIVKLKIRVKFTDYKQGRSEVRILDDEEIVIEKPAPKPTKKP